MPVIVEGNESMLPNAVVDNSHSEGLVVSCSLEKHVPGSHLAPFRASAIFCDRPIPLEIQALNRRAKILVDNVTRESQVNTVLNGVVWPKLQMLTCRRAGADRSIM